MSASPYSAKLRKSVAGRPARKSSSTNFRPARTRSGVSVLPHKARARLHAAELAVGTTMPDPMKLSQ